MTDPLVGLRFMTTTTLLAPDVGAEYDSGLIACRYADDELPYPRYGIDVYMCGKHVHTFSCRFPYGFNATEWVFYVSGHREFN